jgi:hypothetical protein
MNTKITKLIEQVGTDTSGKWLRIDNAEKLIMLIVKECATQCDPEPGFKYSPNSLSSRNDCKTKILNHFGVEKI